MADEYDVLSVEVDFAVERLSFLSGILIAMETDNVVEFNHKEINGLGWILNEIKNELKDINYEWRSYGTEPLPKDRDPLKKRLRILSDQILVDGDRKQVHEGIRFLDSIVSAIRLREAAKKGKGKPYDEHTKGL